MPICFNEFSTRQYHEDAEYYQATGQLIWNLSRTNDPCGQERDIAKYYRHPNCEVDRKLSTFFDFAIFQMTRPFDITGRTYPTAYFPNSAEEMLFLIRQANVNKDPGDCMIPMFNSRNRKPARFNWNSFVRTIPFKTQCVRLLCERSPPDDAFTRMCTKRFAERSNGTMLCARFRERERVPLISGRHPYWYKGSPFTCDGIAYGLAAQPKIRKDFAHPPTYDFNFVVTFLRIWAWLVRAMNNHSPPWLDNIYVENTTDVQFKKPDPFQFVQMSAKLIQSDANTPKPSLSVNYPSLSYATLWGFIAYYSR